MDNPYQPPSSPEPPPLPPADLRDPHLLAVTSVWLYGIATVAEVADLVLRSTAPLPDLSTLDLHLHDTYHVEPLFGPLDWFMLIGGLASAVLYLVWKYRAACNARILNSTEMRISPAMAIGSYFIPLVFFVVPFLAMAGISRATLGHARGVGLWWAAHIGLLILGFFTVFTSDDALVGVRPPPVEHAYTIWSMGTFLLSWWLVIRIARAQSAKCRPHHAF